MKDTERKRNGDDDQVCMVGGRKRGGGERVACLACHHSIWHRGSVGWQLGFVHL